MYVLACSCPNGPFSYLVRKSDLVDNNCPPRKGDLGIFVRKGDRVIFRLEGGTYVASLPVYYTNSIESDPIRTYFIKNMKILSGILFLFGD
jgi:hypothetical protein